MQEYVFTTFIVIWELVCCRIFMSAFINKKRYHHAVISECIFLLQIILCLFSVEWLGSMPYLKTLVVIFVFAGGMCIIYQMSMMKAIMLTMFFMGIGMICDYMVMILFRYFFENNYLVEPVYQSVSMLMTILSRIILMVIIWIICRKLSDAAENILSEFEWRILTLIPLITIISIIAIIVKDNMLYQNAYNNVHIYVICGMAAMNFIVFFLVERIKNREFIIRENQIQREKMKHETEMYYSLAENLEYQRKQVHEFKNHLACVSELARVGNYDELLRYAGDITQKMNASVDYIETNNNIVNAVLNAKYRESIEKDITFVLKINDLSELHIADTDIVTILANLLNNAIEGCADSKEKVIKMKIVLESGKLLISIKNSANKKVVSDGEIYYTTKKDDSKEHGFGIKNILDIVNKYNGMYLINSEENEFSFCIMI